MTTALVIVCGIAFFELFLIIVGAIYAKMLLEELREYESEIDPVPLVMYETKIYNQKGTIYYGKETERRGLAEDRPG